MSARRRWRRYFLTGLVVVAPIGVTFVVLKWLFQTLDAILGQPLEDIAGVHVPGLGLLLLVVVVFGAGWLANYAIGRQVISWWTGLLARVPLLRHFYTTLTQIADTIAGGERRLFLRTVLVPQPGGDGYRLGWVTAEDNPAAEQALGEPCLNVFLPATPNAATGLVLVVPKSRTRPLNVTVEEGVQFVISAGASPLGTRTPA